MPGKIVFNLPDVFPLKEKKACMPLEVLSADGFPQRVPGAVTQDCAKGNHDDTITQFKISMGSQETGKYYHGFSWDDQPEKSGALEEWGQEYEHITPMSKSAYGIEQFFQHGISCNNDHRL